MARTAITPILPGGTVAKVPRSYEPGNASDPTATDTDSKKRGRGRPSKAKSESTQEGTVPAKPSGRPRRNVAGAVATSTVAAAVKSRARPTRSTPPTGTASVGDASSRKRGRPKKDTVTAETVTRANKKRGRNPNVSVAAAQQPVRSTRKKKTASVATVGANRGDLKKQTALLQKKVKEAAAKLKVAVRAIEEVAAIADGM